MCRKWFYHEIFEFRDITAGLGPYWALSNVCVSFVTCAKDTHDTVTAGGRWRRDKKFRDVYASWNSVHYAKFGKKVLEVIWKDSNDTLITKNTEQPVFHDGTHRGCNRVGNFDITLINVSIVIDVALFQFYMFHHRTMLAQKFFRVVATALRLIVLTVGAPSFGKRRNDALFLV